MTDWNESDWARLATLFGHVCEHGPDCAGVCGAGAPYSGYRPNVREAPNGGTKMCNACGGKGRVSVISVVPVAHHAAAPGMACPTCKGTGRVPNTDAGPAGKRYLHVAEKYLARHPGLEWPREYLARAYYEICRVADALHVPDAYYPRPEDTTLRVLEYPSAGHRHVPESPFFCDDCGRQTHSVHTGANAVTPLDDGVCPKRAPGAGTAEHTDFDLFTIVCWRETPEDLERPHAETLAGPLTMNVLERRHAAERLSPGLHIGEIGEMVGLGPATPHRVPARPYVQRSIVAFAMPRLDARLPGLPPDGLGPVTGVCGPTVREWLAERMARSRYEASR